KTVLRHGRAQSKRRLPEIRAGTIRDIEYLWRMNKKAHKIALVTHQNHTTALSNEEDQNLLYFLRSRGLDMHYEIWDNPDVDWPSYDAVILKSTWDYHEKYDRF